MADINNKMPLGIENHDLAVELIESLSEWALREGYSHPPGELAKLFVEKK